MKHEPGFAVSTPKTNTPTTLHSLLISYLSRPSCTATSHPEAPKSMPKSLEKKPNSSQRRKAKQTACLARRWSKASRRASGSSRWTRRRKKLVPGIATVDPTGMRVRAWNMLPERLIVVESRLWWLSSQSRIESWLQLWKGIWLSCPLGLNKNVKPWKINLSQCK